MEQQLIQSLTTTFEGHAQQTEDGIEYWLARDLQHLLGYGKWDNFVGVISKAKTACEISGHAVYDHFADVGKMVELGSGSQREIDDIMVTRYACYLIAQNGDPRKQQVAFAQTYFAMQTRKAELIEQRLLEAERVEARQKLSATEKELSNVIYEQTGGNNNFALIRSKGDTALFGRNTKAMKAQWQVPDNRPLADFAPTIILKAKDFATEITIHNARTQQMTQEPEISSEHVTNNKAVRETLLNRGSGRKACRHQKMSKRSNAAWPHLRKSPSKTGIHWGEVNMMSKAIKKWCDTVAQIDLVALGRTTQHQTGAGL